MIKLTKDMILLLGFFLFILTMMSIGKQRRANQQSRSVKLSECIMKVREMGVPKRVAVRACRDWKIYFE